MKPPRYDRTTYRTDPASAWPHVKHPHEAGYGPRDCQVCRSPRVFVASNVRMCASCGYVQQPSDRCLDCNCQLNSRSRDMAIGLCLTCRKKDDDHASVGERDATDTLEEIAWMKEEARLANASDPYELYPRADRKSSRKQVDYILLLLSRYERRNSQVFFGPRDRDGISRLTAVQAAAYIEKLKTGLANPSP